jgi:hypothetical protein
MTFIADMEWEILCFSSDFVAMDLGVYKIYFMVKDEKAEGK